LSGNLQVFASSADNAHIEASSLATSASTSGVVSRRTRPLRFQADERLIALVREGHDWAFEALFNRYQPRLLAFCQRLVSSPQDAEDVLQEVFAAAHAAILANDRPINARPWLYRIARNRCINHLRKPTADGVDSMDVHVYENGATTLERVQQREELRAIVSDVHRLPKTQRTALTLRAIDDLSYTNIAHTMGTTLPSVKSLLTRARTTLAQTSAARGALAPLGLLTLLRKLIPAKLGGASSAGGTAGSFAAAGGSGVTVGGTAVTGIGGALGAKAAVGMATAALIAAGAASVDEANLDRRHAMTTESAPAVAATMELTGAFGPLATSAHAVPGGAAGAPGVAAASRAGRGRAASAPGRAAHGAPRVDHPAHPDPAKGAAAGIGQTVKAATPAAAALGSLPKPPKPPAAPNGIGPPQRPATTNELPAWVPDHVAGGRPLGGVGRPAQLPNRHSLLPH
jgi:RNA polymerase sigma factor (sigma-70 family)